MHIVNTYGNNWDPRSGRMVNLKFWVQCDFALSLQATITEVRPWIIPDKAVGPGFKKTYKVGAVVEKVIMADCTPGKKYKGHILILLGGPIYNTLFHQENSITC